MKNFVFLVKNNWLQKGMAGWGNGYIVLSQSNQYYGKDYNEINDELSLPEELTYSEMNEYGQWVVGWDSAHGYQDKDIYTMDFVLKQTKEIADIFEKFEMTDAEAQEIKDECDLNSYEAQTF